MKWSVTEVRRFSHKVVFRLENPGEPLAVEMTWDGATRSYKYAGTAMRVEPRFHPALERALRNFFNQPSK